MPKFCPIERAIGLLQRLRAPMTSRPDLSQLLRSERWGRRFLSSPPYRIEDRRQAGFTLLELLVVLAILGLLIGLVGPRVMQQFGSAKEKVAHLSIGRLATALDMYKLDVGTYPTAEQGLQALVTKPSGVANWRGPYMTGEKVPEDPWGRPFVYHSPSQRAGHEFDLYSLGPAGQGTSTASSTIILNE
jgi:general secretion pathway protein G